MLLIFHIILRFIRAEFAVANLIFISFLLFPSIVNVAPRYFYFSTVSSVSPFIVITWLFENLFTMILLFSRLNSIPYAAEQLYNLSASCCNYGMYPAIKSMSSSNLRLQILYPPTAMVEVWLFRVSCIIFSDKILNRVGDRRQPCRTPTDVRKESPLVSLTITALLAFLYRFSMTDIRCS